MHSRTQINIFFLSIFLLSFQFLSLFGQSPQYENKIIEKIQVVLNTPSNEEFDAESVKLMLKTKEQDHFSQSEFDNDLKALSQNFDRVIPEITIADQKVYITLKISLKPLIHTIYWAGNEKVKTKCLEQELQIAHRTVFDRQAFNKAFHKLKAYYVKEGFFEAELDYNITYNPLCNEVDIEISIVEGRAGRIKKILFCGLDLCEMDAVMDLMVTKKYNYFMSWFTNNGTYNEDAIQQDQFVILNYLQNRGYSDAKVNINISEAREPNRIIVCINVDKGSVYTIGDISYQGNTLFCDEEIEKRIQVNTGDAYSPEEINKTIEAIKGLYGKYGYIDAYVDYEPKLLPDNCAYSLHFTISEGEQFRVGMVKVLGNCTTQTGVILHETLLIPGKIFNSEKLEATESRLKNIGFFSNVNVYAVKSENCADFGENYRDIHIEVEETSTGNLGGSLGGSTAEGFFAGLNLTENNFNMMGMNRVRRDGYKALRGGGEYAHLGVTVGSKSRAYVASWAKPYFMDSQWSVGFDAENSSTRYIDKHYNILATGFTLHMTKQLNSFLRLGYHYRIRNTKVEITGDSKLTARDKKELHSDGIISAVGTSLVYDSTDHPLRPTTGFKSRLESELAGVGGDYQFFAVAYLNSYYIPLDKDTVLKFRADARFINPILQTHARDVPLDERLFLGGDNTVRGYRPYKLGPRFYGTKDPKGAMSLQFLSVECNRRLLRQMDVFVFCDSGSASFANWGFNRMYTSVGVGTRVKFFEGAPPLEFGFGYPLNPKLKKNGKQKHVKNFFLNMGCKF